MLLLTYLYRTPFVFTACTVVQAVVKATSDWERPNFDPLGFRNPWTDFDETWNI